MDSMAREIAMRWITARPGCTGEQAHALRRGAEAAAAGFEQAEKDLEAEAKEARGAETKAKEAKAKEAKEAKATR